MTEPLIYQKNVSVVSSLRAAERAGQASRQQAIESAFEGTQTIVINTSKSAKAQALLAQLELATGQRFRIGESAHLYRDTLPELHSPSALKVARSKALRPRRERQGLAKDAVTAGADVNAFIRGERGNWTQQTKLDRLGRTITEQERLALYQELFKQYCTPASGKVEIVWQLATHIINGVDHAIADRIHIIADQIDKELLIQYLDQAEENGLLYSSNLHFAALECLIDSGKIRNVAVLPKELHDREYTSRELWQAPTPALTAALLGAIITNTPVEF